MAQEVHVPWLTTALMEPQYPLNASKERTITLNNSRSASRVLRNTTVLKEYPIIIRTDVLLDITVLKVSASGYSIYPYTPSGRFWESVLQGEIEFSNTPSLCVIFRPGLSQKGVNSLFRSAK